MKKMLAFFLCLLCATALVACGPMVHEHLKGQWEFNESQHWQSVTCTWNLCTINIVSYDHIDDNADGFCDVCGYPKSTFFANGTTAIPTTGKHPKGMR